MKKKMLALVLAVTMIASSLVACGGKETANTGNTDAAAEKQLVVQVGPDPETIDPALNSASDGGCMILHAFEGLLTYSQDEQLQPGCADLPEISEDGLTWTFKLFEGLKWSDGTDLTAHDFVYSWKRVCDPATAAPYAETVLGMVKGYDEAINGNVDALGVTATDDHTLVVELANPCFYFGDLAAFATLSPVQQATIEANGDAWATSPETYVSNGSFHVTEWVPGSHIIMSKNEYYRNADDIKLDSIKFVLMEDSNAAFTAYQSGEVMMIKDVPTEEIPSLEGQADFHVEPIIGTYYVSVNTAKEPFTDVNVRKALSLAIDREYVASTIMQGTYSPAYNFMGPGWMDADGSEFIANSNNGEGYISADFEANLAEAKALLAEAGYPDGEGFPAFTYSTNEAGYHKPVAEYLQQAWAELGLSCSVEIVEWSSFTPMRRAGEYDIARNGWVGDYPDASNQLELLYSTNGNNDGKFNSAEFDAAMDLSRQTADAAERSAALHEAEDILFAEAGCIPLAYYNDFWLQSEDIEGIWHSPRGYWYFMYGDVK